MISVSEHSPPSPLHGSSTAGYNIYHSQQILFFLQNLELLA